MSKSIPNYELKAQVLNNGCVAQTIKLKKYNYHMANYEDSNNAEDYNKAYKVLSTMSYKEYSDIEIKEAMRVISSQYQRTKRLKDKMLLYLLFGSLKYSQCLFLTLTFTDKVLASTSQETRRRYVHRWLKSISSDYIANIDFGSDREYTTKNGDVKKATKREHYHAVILCDKVDYTGWHHLGAIKSKKVVLSALFNNDLDSVNLHSSRLSRYVSKLSNHAIKETTKQSRLIYSRNSALSFCSVV